LVDPRSRHDADAMTKVVERMTTYPQLAFPLAPQRLVAAPVGGGEDPLEHRLAGWRRQAQYLSCVNLSSNDRWAYPFKTHPRPNGRATQVIYTESVCPLRGDIGSYSGRAEPQIARGHRHAP
jgi:hypothetical protein